MKTRQRSPRRPFNARAEHPPFLMILKAGQSTLVVNFSAAMPRESRIELACLMRGAPVFAELLDEALNRLSAVGCEEDAAELNGLLIAGLGSISTITEE